MFTTLLAIIAKYQYITTLVPNYWMGFAVSCIVKMSMNKIAL